MWDTITLCCCLPGILSCQVFPVYAFGVTIFHFSTSSVHDFLCFQERVSTTFRQQMETCRSAIVVVTVSRDSVSSFQVFCGWIAFWSAEAIVSQRFFKSIPPSVIIAFTYWWQKTEKPHLLFYYCFLQIISVPLDGSQNDITFSLLRPRISIRTMRLYVCR